MNTKKWHKQLTEQASKLWGFPLTHNPTPPAGEGPVYYVTLVTTIDNGPEHGTRLSIDVGTTPPLATFEITEEAVIMRHVNLTTRNVGEASRRQDQLAEGLREKHGGELGYQLADRSNPNPNNFYGIPQAVPLDMQDTDHLRQLAAVAYEGFRTDGRGFLSEFIDDNGPIITWTTPDMANATADKHGQPRLMDMIPALPGMVASYDPETEFVFLDDSSGANMIYKVPCPGGSCQAVWEADQPGTLDKAPWTA